MSALVIHGHHYYHAIYYPVTDGVPDVPHFSGAL